jgi:hypothetical protein
MNSGTTRGFTVVTIMTLIFAPLFKNHHWVYGPPTLKTETHVEQCVPQKPCPAFKLLFDIVKPPLPSDPPAGSHDSGGSYGPPSTWH